MDETSSACEDLRYFERRLTEVIQSMHPSATRWRCTSVIDRFLLHFMECLFLADGSIDKNGAYLCGMFEEGNVKPVLSSKLIVSFFQVTLLESLQKHIIFSASVPSLLILFAYIGIHNRVVAPSMFVFFIFHLYKLARVELVIRSFE
uniref:Transmembrane protein 188 n=1 Tax=Ascaris lumbricoides TaxID=6252 RepID=A0A9J2P4A4_ASCLU